MTTIFPSWTWENVSSLAWFCFFPILPRPSQSIADVCHLLFDFPDFCSNLLIRFLCSPLVSSKIENIYFSLQSIWLHFFPWELSSNYFLICTNPLWQLEMKAGLLSPWPFLIIFNAFSLLTWICSSPVYLCQISKLLRN